MELICLFVCFVVVVAVVVVVVLFCFLFLFCFCLVFWGEGGILGEFIVNLAEFLKLIFLFFTLVWWRCFFPTDLEHVSYADLEHMSYTDLSILMAISSTGPFSLTLALPNLKTCSNQKGGASDHCVTF